ncbi:MAG: polysaccharide deacetylase [Proteobacteria bacterium]|nr:polysaccharide deacetylase [Pseudomonadota bacterium]
MSDPIFPVVFGIDFDAEAIWFGKVKEGEKRPVLFSHGAFAVREGLRPLLDLFDEHAIKATFFIPGVTAERHPDAVGEIARRGHEAASHGYRHRSITLLSREEERDELVKGIEAVERVTRVRPPTWRSPSWEFSEHTLDLLVEAGVMASANFHDRLRPYRHVRDGLPLPVVELPVQWHLADAPYFLYGGLPGRVLATPSAALEVWRDEFVGLYEDRPGSFFHLTLHVQLIGHPGRLRMLERLIRLIMDHPRARFMRCDELAASVP